MRRAARAVALAVLLAACGTATAGQPQYVDLSQRVALPAEGTGDVLPLRIAVAAILSPEGTVESYSALADYLSGHLGRPAEILQRRTYQEINDLLETGLADIGFVCTSAYVRGKDDFGLRLLAAPEIGGERVYYSELIVPADSDAGSMADLRGATFAFTDPMSTTGRVFPTSLVAELGETPETFFSRYFFTYSHERAIESVAEGVADGAGVDSLVLDYVRSRRPGLNLKVIDRSPAFGIPPVVVSPLVPPQQAAELQELLLGLASDPAASQVLAALGIDAFVAVDDSAYDGVRVLIESTELGP